MSTLTCVRLKMPPTSLASLHVRIVSSFDDPLVAPQRWNKLLARGQTDSVNLTWEWQRNWWHTFGRGKLLLMLVERDGQTLCIAPLFAEHGMVFNICPEDQLDFIGNVSGTEVMVEVIQSLFEYAPDFQGMKLYFIPATSSTGVYLEQAAERLGLACFQEDCRAAPRLDIAAQPDLATLHTRKKSLVRHENYFRRTGQLAVKHTRDAADILPQLDEFFSQHIARRNATPDPSLFVDPNQREYYRSIVTSIGPKGWLRFTRLDWNGRAIAFHFGLSYHGRFLFGIPSFDVEFQRHSPGEVLLRQLLLAAIEEGATVFDFGPGEEAYKYRFATSQVRLVTWGIYPKPSSPSSTVR
jgi:CelD/BcsL family acetyltransferase involved in cellulose biosynthesis